MSGYTEIALLQYEIEKLRAERSALRAELREICAAIDDPACDLTLTAVECIKKLKAENDSLRKDAERYRWLRENNWFVSGIVVIRPRGRSCHENVEYLDAAIDAAMAQGEK